MLKGGGSLLPNGDARDVCAVAILVVALAHSRRSRNALLGRISSLRKHGEKVDANRVLAAEVGMPARAAISVKPVAPAPTTVAQPVLTWACRMGAVEAARR